MTKLLDKIIDLHSDKKPYVSRQTKTVANQYRQAIAFDIVSRDHEEMDKVKEVTGLDFPAALFWPFVVGWRKRYHERQIDQTACWHWHPHGDRYNDIPAIGHPSLCNSRNGRPKPAVEIGYYLLNHSSTGEVIIPRVPSRWLRLMQPIPTCTLREQCVNPDHWAAKDKTKGAVYDLLGATEQKKEKDLNLRIKIAADHYQIFLTAVSLATPLQEQTRILSEEEAAILKLPPGVPIKIPTAAAGTLSLSCRPVVAHRGKTGPMIKKSDNDSSPYSFRSLRAAKKYLEKTSVSARLAPTHLCLWPTPLPALSDLPGDSDILKALALELDLPVVCTTSPSPLVLELRKLTIPS